MWGYPFAAMSHGPASAPLLLVPVKNLSVQWIEAEQLRDDLFQADAGVTAEGMTLPIQLFGPPCEVLMIGDSLISGAAASASLLEFQADSWTGQDMGQALVAQGVNVQNMGVGGHTSAHVWARWTADVLEQQPQVVILHVGGNNIGIGQTPETIAAAQQVWLDHLRQMLDSALGAKIHPVVLGIMPRTVWCIPNVYWASRARRAWNQAAQELIARFYANRVSWVDTDLLVGVHWPEGDPGNLDALNPALRHGDGIHLNSDGQRVVGEVLASLLSNRHSN